MWVQNSGNSSGPSHQLNHLGLPKMWWLRCSNLTFCIVWEEMSPLLHRCCWSIYDRVPTIFVMYPYLLLTCDCVNPKWFTKAHPQMCTPFFFYWVLSVACFVWSNKLKQKQHVCVYILVNMIVVMLLLIFLCLAICVSCYYMKDLPTFTEYHQNLLHACKS